MELHNKITHYSKMFEFYSELNNWSSYFAFRWIIRLLLVTNWNTPYSIYDNTDFI